MLPAADREGDVAADTYLRRLDGVVYGADPRQGYFIGGRFVHPALEFELSFPDGWETANMARAVLGQTQNASFQLTFASGGYTDAADAFFADDAIEASDVRRMDVNGQRAVTGRFRAATEQGAMLGVATFLEYRNRTYRLLGYQPATASADLRVLDEVTRSFRRLTDRDILRVQPLRIELVRVSRATTLQRMASERPVPIDVAELAIINGVALTDSLAAGSTIKWVVGDRVPGS